MGTMDVQLELVERLDVISLFLRTLHLAVP